MEPHLTAYLRALLGLFALSCCSFSFDGFQADARVPGGDYRHTPARTPVSVAVPGLRDGVRRPTTQDETGAVIYGCWLAARAAHRSRGSPVQRP